MIQLRDLDVERNGRSLGHLDHLEAAPGEVIGVIGRSGCGKTTLLEALAGVRSLGAGARFWVDGVEAASFRDISVRTIQSFPLFHWLRASQIINLATAERGVEAASPDLALEIMHAGHLFDRFPHEMSGGERARVTLAAAWSIQARVLLLDEPFNGLDAVSKKELVEDILISFRELGAIVFIVSHALEDIVDYATRCLAFVGADIREIQPITRDNLMRAIA